MATLLPKLIAACAVALATAGMCMPAAAAGATASAKEKHPKAEKVLKAQAKKKPSKKAAAAGAAVAGTAAAAAVAANPLEVDEPDITDTKITEYACELNNKVTIYTNATDDSHIALRWKHRLHRLSRVGTTTGALRFENPHWGLIWIGIPAKGILLDSKLNRQLANECKNAEQSAIVATAAPEATKS
jgi:membrane-bound inhibitor of C-type lysozyme